ncbi:hypothetical protein UFOVP1254_95 [uncultured Caudovirales phage]|uniref:DUF6950 domain-containing protein n=1 Tax=uncultured Caudovirales phage TaxID=2100421 RepID=A0A6J5RBY0_9CAUD|nr:hypothetical protein UFOVP1254_95 [uncultured Caudovirales phage]
MKRPDWQIWFAEFCRQRETVPFAWGTNDCVLFAADCVLAMTGVDHAAQFRGYTSATHAARLIKKLGGLEAIVTRALGQPIDLNKVTAGDVVLVNIESGNALGIYSGNACLGPGKDGIMAVGRTQIIAAWKVS